MHDRMYPVSFTMPQDVLEDLEQLAEANGCNRSEMVRLLIKNALNGGKKTLVDPSPPYRAEAAS